MVLFSKLPLEDDLVDTKGELTSGTIARVTAGTYIDADGVLQVADGDTANASHASVETEAGYTDVRGSFVDGQTWFDGEVLGGELVTNGDMELDSEWDDLNLEGGETNERSAVQVYAGSFSRHIDVDDAGEGVQGDTEVSFTSGKLYKLVFYYYLVSGEFTVDVNGDDPSFDIDDISSPTNRWVKVVEYATASSSNSGGVRAYSRSGGAEWYIDDISIKEVTSLSTQYAGTANLLIIDDTSAKGYGFIGEAGTGETLDSDLFDANKGTFTEAALLGAEAIDDSDNQDFADGTINEWTMFANGTPLSTVLYEGTDPGAEKVGEITFNDDGGGTYVYAKLNQNSWTVSANTLHKMTLNVYCPAANTSNVVRITTNGFGAAVANETIATLNDNTWTEMVLYFYVAADVIGEIRVGYASAAGAATGDIIYFDDISIKPIDISWVPYGTNTMEIDSDALKITYVDNANGAYLELRDSKDLSADLTEGKLYKIAGQVKVGAGDTCRVSETAGYTYVDISSTTFVPFELYFTKETGVPIIFTPIMGAGEEIWLDNLVLTEVTEPNANAVKIYKEYSLTNEGWNALDDGIDYNAGATWDFDVYNNLMITTGSAAEARFEALGLLSEGEGTNWQLGSDFNTGNGTDWSSANDDADLRYDGASMKWQLVVDEGNGGATTNTISSDSVRADAAARSAQFEITGAGIAVDDVKLRGRNNIQIVNGEDYTISFWIKTSASKTAIPITSGTGGLNSTFDTVANTWTYISKSYTSGATASTERVPVIDFGDDGLYTVNIECLQFEHTPYATSWIPTTTIPVTRTTDSHSWTMSAAFKNLMGTVADSPFTMVVEWVPKFDYGDTGGNEGVISIRNSSYNIFATSNTGLLVANDGSTSSFLDPNYASGTPYVFALRVYDDSGMKFEVGEKHGGSWTWDGSPANYDGSFNPSTDLIIGYNNEYPFNIKNIYFWDEAKSQAWIEAGSYDLALSVLTYYQLHHR